MKEIFNKKQLYFIKRWQIMAIIITLLILIDQIIKYTIVKNMVLGQEIKLLGNFLSFKYILNTGAAWSILAGTKFLLVAITTLVICALFWLISKYKNDTTVVYCLTFIIGGAFGNLYDRIFNNGVVIDYIAFDFGFYKFPVFNFADMCIFIAGFILIVSTFKNQKESNNE